MRIRLLRRRRRQAAVRAAGRLGEAGVHPPKGSEADGAAVQLLLQDFQTRFGPDGDEAYQEMAFKILTPQGLATMGAFIVPWRPDVATLTLHRLEIIRDGRAIDLLGGGKAVTVLRRETNLEASTLDGTLTATVQRKACRWAM
ncbi:MAG: DUF3857 domain-containing protein [Caulobacteraceae bacterium]